MLSNREGPMVSSIEMDGKQRTVEERMRRGRIESNGGRALGMECAMCAA
jgi:hypothetical protein